VHTFHTPNTISVCTLGLESSVLNSYEPAGMERPLGRLYAGITVADAAYAESAMICSPKLKKAPGFLPIFEARKQDESCWLPGIPIKK